MAKNNTAGARMFATKNNLPEAARKALVGLLNQALADTADLYSQLKQAHWNVKGLHFIALHELFDKLAEGVEGHVDEIAERVTALGGYATGTVRMSAGASRLPEFPADALEGAACVGALVERYAALGASVRAAIQAAADHGDADTSDLFTGFSRDLDKDLWFLEAHLTR